MVALVASRGSRLYGRCARFVLLLTSVVLVTLAAPAGAVAAAGDLDPSFGSGGVVTLASGTQLNAVAVAPDGQIVAVGDSGSSMLVARFSATGALESTFAAGNGVARAVAIQSDGKIVVAGNDSTGMLVERFNANGSPDGSFGSGGGGVVHVTLAGGQANAVALGPGGTIVAAGQLTAGDGYTRVAVLRLSSSGQPDTSIGAGGVDVVDLGPDSTAKGVAVQGDGKIVIAGSNGPANFEVTNGLAVRLDSDGKLDSSFASGGEYVYGHPGGGAGTLNAVALDPSGSIVLAGGDSQSTPQAVFVRLSCGGTPVAGFGSDGVSTMPSAVNYFGQPLGIAGVAIAGGEHIVGAGQWVDSAESYVGVWGLNSSGSQAFFNDSLAGAEASAIAIDPSGNLIVAGNDVMIGSTQATNGLLARYVGFGAPTTGGSPCGGSGGGGSGGQAPSVTTGAASAVTKSGASLSGSVNPNGQASSYHFDYGPTTAYGSSTATSSAAAGSAAIAVSAALSGLASGTTYHYRLVAANASGTALGADRTFTTAGPPASRVEVFGHTAFVSSSGVAGVFLGCFGTQRCVGAITVSSGGKVIGSRKTETINANDGGIVHLTLTTAGRGALRHAHGQLAIKIAVHDHNGPSDSATATLVEFG